MLDNQRARELARGRERADAQRAVDYSDLGERRDALDVDDRIRVIARGA